MEGFQAIAGATSRHRSATTARGSTHKHGAKCVVANTYGMFYTRSEYGHAHLARGSRTTPEAPEAGWPRGAAGCARSDCRAGGERIQNCVHGRVLQEIGPQRHAQGGWFRGIHARR